MFAVAVDKVTWQMKEKIQMGMCFVEKVFDNFSYSFLV